MAQIKLNATYGLTGALPAVSGASLTGLSSGLAEADTWRVNSSSNVSAGASTLTANWERDDAYGHGLLGTGMSQSSGVFTFPSTGFWLVTGGISFINDNGGLQAKYLGLHIQLTTDNATYYNATSAYNSNAPEASNIYSFARTSKIVDYSLWKNWLIK